MTLAPADWIPRWADFLSALRAGKSAIAHGPRHSLQTTVMRELAAGAAQVGCDGLLHLRSDEYSRAGQIDWAEAWTTMARQLRLNGSAGKAAHSVQIRNRLRRWLESSATPRRTLVLLDAGSSRSVEARFEMLCLLEEVLTASPDRIIVAVLDDYSLYHYENWRTEGASRWNFERVYLRPVGAAEIGAALSRLLPTLNARVRTRQVDGILGLTGGHLTLALELLNDIHERGGVVPPRYFDDEGPARLASTHAFESMRRSLLQDRGRLVERAIEFEIPKVVPDMADPSLQTLRMIGVLQWTSFVRARLCPGIVTTLVRELHEDVADTDPAKKHLTPSVVTGQSRPRSRDFTIVHLSDLHVGDAYAFATMSPAAPSFRSAERDLATLLGKDLAELPVDHIDALVLSGDLTCRASNEEFIAARAVIGDLLGKAGVSWDRVVVVAGNHDVRWSPPPDERTDPRTGVSRHQFATFRAAVGKGDDVEAELTTVVSRDGASVLRIVSLDSNLVEGPDAGGVGFVSTDALQKADALLRDHRSQVDARQRMLTWIVVHHHVLPVTSASSLEAFARRTSVLANAPAILSFAARWDAEAILHGHQHQPSLILARRWPVDHAAHMRPMLVAGAGSVGSRLSDLGLFGRNHYFVYVRRERDLLVRSRMTGDEGLSWVTHGDLSIPLD